jgi:predicted secreted protein
MVKGEDIMKRSKRIVMVSHCILNQNSVVKPLARAKGAFPISKMILEEGVGIIQLPCPEFKYLGLDRKPMSKEEYDSKDYRNLCRKLFNSICEDLQKYIESGYDFIGIVGINHSPTCSISSNMGIYMEEIFEILQSMNIEFKTFEIPTDYDENSSDENFEMEFRKFLG